MSQTNVSTTSTRDGALSLLVVGLIFLSLSIADVKVVAADSNDPSNPISSDELLNLTYPNAFATDGAAALVGGAYSEPVVAESAATIVVEFRRAAFGLIDGRDAAAVVLASSGGGSGTFYDLHLVMRGPEGSLRSVAQRTLGDRIGLQGLRFMDETIRIDFAGFAEDDAACCPTLNVVQVLTLEDGALALSRAEAAPALLAVPEGLSLIGWFGGPTTSSAILSASSPLATIWSYVPEDGSWLADSRLLPKFARQTIRIDRGSGLFVSARWATQIPAPLMPPPPACPLNPGPPNATDASIRLQLPGNGERLSGAVPISGVARVFEGTVSIRVLAADGSILAESFTTAAVGGPWFGTFASEVAVSVAEQTEACVQVFERSALDGSSVNVVQVGVVLMPTS